jgi:hypothetical protein
LDAQQAKLSADNAALGSVALSGGTALIGAYLEDTTAGRDAGLRVCFCARRATWTKQAKLSAATGQLMTGLVTL